MYCTNSKQNENVCFPSFGDKIFKHRLKIGLRKDSFLQHLKEIFSGLVVVEQMLPGPDRRQMSGGALHIAFTLHSNHRVMFESSCSVCQNGSGSE